MVGLPAWGLISLGGVGGMGLGVTLRLPAFPTL